MTAIEGEPMIGGISNAFAGMQNASRLFERSAAQLASPAAAGGGGDSLTAVVDAVGAKDGFDINIAVLRSALDMQKQVLDILV